MMLWYRTQIILCSTILIFLLENRLARGQGVILQSKAAGRGYLKDKVVNSRLLWKHEVQGRSPCLGKCVQNASCASIFYNKITKQCQGHSITFGPNSTAEDDTGSQYFVMPHGERYLGDACSQNADCDVAYSECRNETCWCMVGYSFSPMTRQCTVCSNYGHDFMEVEAGFISRHNTEVIPSLTLEECFSQCRNRTEYECRTIEYGLTSHKCYLQNIILLDIPEEERPLNFFFDWDREFNITHFQRDCDP